MKKLDALAQKTKNVLMSLPKDVNLDKIRKSFEEQIYKWINSLF